MTCPQFINEDQKTLVRQRQKPLGFPKKRHSPQIRPKNCIHLRIHPQKLC